MLILNYYFWCREYYVDTVKKVKAESGHKIYFFVVHTKNMSFIQSKLIFPHEEDKMKLLKREISKEE